MEIQNVLNKMMELDIKIITEEGVDIPVYATDGSSGFDIKVVELVKLYKDDKELDITQILKNTSKNGYFYLRAGERALLRTGMWMEIPKGFELQARSRSGSSLKRGITVTNSPGTIDSDYRGEVGIILSNTTNNIAKITLREALAQGVIAPVVKGIFHKVDKLSSTVRGEGGFGSTNMQLDSSKTNLESFIYFLKGFKNSTILRTGKEGIINSLKYINLSRDKRESFIVSIEVDKDNPFSHYLILKLVNGIEIKIVLDESIKNNSILYANNY